MYINRMFGMTVNSNNFVITEFLYIQFHAYLRLKHTMIFLMQMVIIRVKNDFKDT